MREENNFSFFFSRCGDEQLPSPEELMPLSQSLISPDLALAFQIHIPINHHRVAKNLVTISDQQLPLPDFGSGAGPGGMDEPARTLKRPRLVWTPQLHKRFVDAVAHLGIKNAVPKTIMQMMNVDGLTRENVASHLQKYRLYLKRVQGISGNHAGAGHDSATDRLFASSPVPAHFLNQGPIISSENLMQSFVPPPATAAAIHRMQTPQYHQTPVGYFSGPPRGKQFEQSYSNIYIQQPIQHRMGVAMQNSAAAVYGENLGSARANGEKKVLSLFPNGED